MKQYTIVRSTYNRVSIIALVIIACLFPSSKTFSQDTVLVFHPTVYNINTINYLFSNLIDSKSPPEYHILGVFHEKEIYNYDESKQFLDENDMNSSFSLQEIHGTPSIEELYKSNEFSEQLNELFKKSIGAFFLGGPDMPPILYGEEMGLLTQVTDPWRHNLEVSAIFHLLGSSRNPEHLALLESDVNYVILGICLGMQTLNVGTGGTMIQDIPSELYSFDTRETVLKNSEKLHRNYQFDDPSDDIYLTGYHIHQIDINNPGNITQKIRSWNTSPYVLSSHHQALDELGLGLVIEALSMDKKIIEIVSHEKYPSVLGVQFHPEKIGIYKSDQIQHVSLDSTLNYNTFLRENKSLNFHLDFWDTIGKLLYENKK